MELHCMNLLLCITYIPMYVGICPNMIYILNLYLLYTRYPFWYPKLATPNELGEARNVLWSGRTITTSLRFFKKYDQIFFLRLSQRSSNKFHGQQCGMHVSLGVQANALEPINIFLWQSKPIESTKFLNWS